ncbi:hypothetical protein DFR72_1011161 [Lentzea flaviverrucosa]|uniref:Uncharacterized protein n=1 Tax=Lentzea flaviverrucosa TaxID=200379 RepID=A0A1H9ESA2_9PSEU|nr:hypothetical protein DFR72_1011161 [Lentzea flaviverrucosa]SEQ28487.1 hypothetical protein SAMN05216195_10256 [Lentzea flaviverrucosa]
MCLGACPSEEESQGVCAGAPDADVPNPSRHVRAGTFVVTGSLPSRPGTPR